MRRRLGIGAMSLTVVALWAPNLFGQAKNPNVAKSSGTVRSGESRPATPTAAKASGAAEAREVEVALKDLPSTVRRTLERESYGGKVLEVEKETKAGKTLFEADVRLDGSVYAVVISADGKLLSKTLDDDDEDGEDDDENEDEDDEDDDDDEEDDDDERPAPRPRPATPARP